MNSYLEYLKKKEEEYDSLCKRCGACCGAYDDPCRHLKKDIYGKYYCEIYEHRFGLRETVSGDKFWCVPIKEIILSSWPRSYLCAYKKRLGSW